MAIRVIDDSKLQDIAVAIQSKDGGGQMTVDQMPTRIEQNLQSKAVLDSLIDGSITSIESDAVSVRAYAFYYNRIIAKIKLKNATVINGAAFMYCSVLSNVYIPLVATINGSVFQECTSITSIFAPSVTRFGTGVFYGCRALSILILHQRTKLDNINSFQNCPAIIYVKPEDLSWYSTATNWSTLYAQDRIKSIEDLTGDDLVWYQEQLARYQAQTA